jgi:opacity protein-like surface antigen
MNTNRGSYLLGAALGSALVLTLCVKAHAADIYEPPAPIVEAPPPPPPLDRGIYLKSYIGQANPDVGNIWTEGYNTNTFHVFHDDIKSSMLYGLGIGWQHSHWLRFDITGEYRGDAIFVGQDSYPGRGFPPGTDEYKADIQSWLGLANAYIDLGCWRGFTPYVGAGIGFATISVNGLEDINTPNVSTFYGADHTTTNFAWALYAGTSYDITPQLALDLSYRYASLGTARSGVATAYNGSSSYSGLFIKDITSNDLLLGFRYKLQHDAPLYAVK